MIIVGGGPAGLSAALILGRARRRVLLCDAGHPRNAAVPAMHGFLSRDGLDPAELRLIARDQLSPYPSVQVIDAEVTSARRVEQRFGITTGDGSRHQARKLLLATGVIDELPAIPGLAELWGHAAFNCPYCDGWEHRDQRLAVLGRAESLLLTLQLSNWTSDLVLATDGPADLDQPSRDSLHARGVHIRDEPVARLHASHRRLQAIEFTNGSRLERDAVFLHPPTRQAGDLPKHLGCDTLDGGSVAINELGQTSVPGVYAAGDLARRPTMPVPGAQVILAAAAGVTAAVGLNVELLGDDITAALPHA